MQIFFVGKQIHSGDKGSHTANMYQFICINIIINFILLFLLPYLMSCKTTLLIPPLKVCSQMISWVVWVMLTKSDTMDFTFMQLHNTAIWKVNISSNMVTFVIVKCGDNYLFELLFNLKDCLFRNGSLICNIFFRVIWGLR